MTLNTLPSLQTSSRRHDNETYAVTDAEEDVDQEDNRYLSMIEAVCVCWMAAEYVLRFWASPVRYVAFTLFLTYNQPRHQGGAHGGRAPAKIVRAPAKITGLIMFHLGCQNFFGILGYFWY